MDGLGSWRGHVHLAWLRPEESDEAMNLFEQIELETQKYLSDLVPFKDIPLGEEFIDLDGNVWQKRTERYGINWIQGEPVERMDFAPEDQVRRKP